MQRRSDVDFFITENGVTFGLFTSVLPQEVVPCLEHYKVGRGQLIRLNCYRRYEHSARVIQNFDIIENILRKAGYGRIVRCAIEDRQKQSAGLVRPVSETRSGSPASSGSGGSSASSATGRPVIRYKKATE